MKSQGATSLVGKQLVGRKHDWSKLDEYASYLHEQELHREFARVVSKKFRYELRNDAKADRQNEKKGNKHENA